MFTLALARAPDTRRRDEAIAFVIAREADGGRAAALADLAHVLFNSSEFLYVE